MVLCHTYSVLPEPLYGIAYSSDLSRIPAYGFREMHYRLRAGEKRFVATQYGGGRIDDFYLHSPSKNNGSIVAEY